MAKKPFSNLTNKDFAIHDFEKAKSKGLPLELLRKVLFNQR